MQSDGLRGLSGEARQTYPLRSAASALRETSEVCPSPPKHPRSVPRQRLGMWQNDLALRLMQRLACQ